MPNFWTIHATGVHGRPPKTELIGCHLAIVTDIDGTHYQFESPGGEPISHSHGRSLPPLPYDFPVFTLAGPGVRPWFITLERLDAGPRGNEAAGRWSNVSYRRGPSEDDPEDEPDTWTAQAGQGAGDDEEKSKELAAYA